MHQRKHFQLRRQRKKRQRMKLDDVCIYIKNKPEQLSSYARPQIKCKKRVSKQLFKPLFTFESRDSTQFEADLIIDKPIGGIVQKAVRSSKFPIEEKISYRQLSDVQTQSESNIDSPLILCSTNSHIVTMIIATAGCRHKQLKYFMW